MAKRPDTFETVRIVLEILKRIPRNRKVSASELHAQLKAAGMDRDIRTIQRQLDSLSEEFDIERDDRSRPYGYRWKERAQGLSLPGLSKQESLLLTLAEQHLRNLLPAPMVKAMSAFFNQARTNLGPTTHAHLERDWLSKVRVVSTTQPLIAAELSSSVFEAVSDALYGNRWLELDYRNAHGKRSKASVMPLGLAQQGPTLYLVCRFRGFSDERSLALHRISLARASTLTFETPKEFDLQKYDDDGRFGFGEGKRIRLSFRISKGAGLHLLESRLSQDQRVTEAPDYYAIKATVVQTQLLEWWLRSFGENVWAVRRQKLAAEQPPRRITRAKTAVSSRFA